MKAKTAVLTVALLVVGSITAAAAQAQDPGGEKHPGATGEIGMPDSYLQAPKAFRFYWEGDGSWLGVTLSDLTAEKAKDLKLPGEYGVEVKEVVEGSPAAKADLAKGDIIVEFAGEKVRSATQLRRLVRETPAGRDVAIVVRRGRETKTFAAKLGEPRDHNLGYFAAPVPPPAMTMPVPRPTPGTSEPNFFFWMGRGARLGISADELTPQLAQYFGVKQGKGILVREVIVGSAAEKAGLKAGDVIVAVDGKEVSTVSALRHALEGRADQKEERTVALTIVRDKHEQTLSVELEPPQQLGPRQITFAGPLVSPEDAEEWAAEAKDLAREYAHQAKEWEQEQRGLQKELQDLQQEMERVHEEPPQALEKEI